MRGGGAKELLNVLRPSHEDIQARLESLDRMQTAIRSTADFAQMRRTMRAAASNPFADGVDADLYGR